MLDSQLQEICTRIVQLGTLVEAALSQTLHAIADGDPTLCDQVIASDAMIDALRSQIDHLALQTLILQQPLAGRDLRFLTAVPPITTDLERAGDNATGIATLLRRMAPLHHANPKPVDHDQSAAIKEARRHHVNDPTEATLIAGLLELGQETVRLFQKTMRAFTQNDVRAARFLWQEDDVVDVRYHMVRHDAMALLTGLHAFHALLQDALCMQRVTYWLWIAHNFERIGDHCTNICERIVFILEGETTMQPQEPI